MWTHFICILQILQAYLLPFPQLMVRTQAESQKQTTWVPALVLEFDVHTFPLALQIAFHSHFEQFESTWCPRNPLHICALQGSNLSYLSILEIQGRPVVASWCTITTNSLFHVSGQYIRKYSTIVDPDHSMVVTSSLSVWHQFSLSEIDHMVLCTFIILFSRRSESIFCIRNSSDTLSSGPTLIQAFFLPSVSPIALQHDYASPFLAAMD